MVDFGYALTGFEGDEEDEETTTIMDECVAGTTGEIEALYMAIGKNPENEDMNVLAVAGLVRADLVPEGFSVEDYPTTFSDPPYAPQSQRPAGSPGASVYDEPEGLVTWRSVVRAPLL